MPMTKKRPAATCMPASNAAVCAERNPQELCRSIASGIHCASDMPDSVVRMLRASLPYLDTEHPFQKEVSQMIRTSLEQRESDLKNRSHKADAFLRETQEASSALPALREQCRKGYQTWRQAQEAASQAAQYSQSMKKAQQQYMSDVSTRSTRKKELLTTIRDLYRPLKDGDFHGDAEEDYLDRKLAKLFETINTLKLDSAAKSRLRRALRQQPSVRSEGDAAAVRRLGDDLDHTVAMLELSELSPSDGPDESKFSEAQMAAEKAKSYQEECVSAISDTERQLGHYLTLSHDAKRARKEADAASAAFLAFCEGPLMAFHQLQDTFRIEEVMRAEMPADEQASQAMVTCHSLEQPSEALEVNSPETDNVGMKAASATPRKAITANSILTLSPKVPPVSGGKFESSNPRAKGSSPKMFEAILP